MPELRLGLMTKSQLVPKVVDTGPVIAQRAVEVHASDTEGSLHERIKTVERAMLVEELPRLLRDPGHETRRHP